MTTPIFWTIRTDNGDTQQEFERETEAEARSLFADCCDQVSAGNLFSAGLFGYDDEGEVIEVNTFDRDSM